MLFELLFKFALTFIIGHFLFIPFNVQLLSLNTAARVFFKLSLGTIGIASAFALFFTAGHTILLILPIIYMVLLLRHGIFPLIREVQIQNNLLRFHSLLKQIYLDKQEVRLLLLHVLVLLLFLAFQLFRNGYFQGSDFYIQDVDFGIYTTVAEYLMETGAEISSPWYALMNTATYQAQPYHYGDLWYAAFTLLPWSEIPPYHHYVFIFLPIVLTITFSALYSLSRIYLTDRHKEWVSILICFLLVFYGIYLYPHSTIARGLFFNTLTVPKSIVFYIGFSLWVHLWAVDKKNIAMVFIGIIPILNIIYLPVVFGAVLLFFLIQGFYDNRYRHQIYLIPGLLIVYIFLFYFTLGEWFIGLKPEKFALNDYLFRVLRGGISGALRFLLFHAPVLGIIFYAWNKSPSKQYKTYYFWWLTGSILFAALSAKALLNNRSAEADQLFYLVGTPIVAIALSYSIPQVLNKASKKMVLLVLSLPILALITYFPGRTAKVDVSFIDIVKDKLAKSNPIGGYLPNPALQNVYTYDPRMCISGSFLKVIGHKYWVNNLSVPSTLTEVKYPERSNAISISPFFRFINDQQLNGQWRNYESAQAQFIDHTEIDYLFVENGTPFPAHLNHCISEIIEDAQSGHKILILQRPCAY